MSSNIAVSVKNLTKSYHIYDKPRDRLMQMLWRGRRTYYREFSALNDVSFDVVKGDSVGVLGHNGAGKSTLLQLLTGTLTATHGSIETKGRIAALLELGAGFNPEFTGRENVYMNAAILGLSKKEIDQKYDAIIAFADIGDFIGRPVKTYSSGMYVRLAFAVAVHTDPELLIIDEALAVGDIRFQMKCLEHMEKMKANGTTILFVSHAPEQVKRFCNKAIWLDKGEVKAIGKANDICNQYQDFMVAGESVAEDNSNSNCNHTTHLPARILSTELDKKTLKPGDDLSLTIEYEVYDDYVKGLLVGAAIFKTNRDYIFGANTYLDKFGIPSTRGIHKVKYRIHDLPLLPSKFIFDVGIFTDGSLITLDYKNSVEEFEVYDDYNSEGLVHIEHDWLCVNLDKKVVE